MKVFWTAMLFFVISTFSLLGDGNPASAENDEKKASMSDDELITSIKSDAYKIGEKCKILSKRYYEKAKVAAKSGKKEMAQQYEVCSVALKEMSDGFEKNKAELVKDGKEKYKRAVIKMKQVSNKIFDKITPED